jgi:hypothetical protein
MWGARKGILSDMKDLIAKYEKGDFWQVDQNFLGEIIYPLIQNDVFIHDEFGDGRKIPGCRKNFEFIGDVYDEFNNRHPDYWKEIKQRRNQKMVTNKKLYSIWRKIQS